MSTVAYNNLYNDLYGIASDVYHDLYGDLYGGTAEPTLNIKYWDNSQWQSILDIRHWDGSNWTTAQVKRYDGNVWIDV